MSVCGFSKGKIIFGDGGGSGGVFGFRLAAQQVWYDGVGSTFHRSRSAKLISEECIIWRLVKKGMNET